MVHVDTLTPRLGAWLLNTVWRIILFVACVVLWPGVCFLLLITTYTVGIGVEDEMIDPPTKQFVVWLEDFTLVGVVELVSIVIIVVYELIIKGDFAWTSLFVVIYILTGVLATSHIYSEEELW